MSTMSTHTCPVCVRSVHGEHALPKALYIFCGRAQEELLCHQVESVINPLMRTIAHLSFISVLLLGGTIANGATNRYLFMGHPREDNNLPGVSQLVQRYVERVDYARYDVVMTGGDQTWNGTSSARYGRLPGRHL